MSHAHAFPSAHDYSRHFARMRMRMCDARLARELYRRRFAEHLRVHILALDIVNTPAAVALVCVHADTLQSTAWHAAMHAEEWVPRCPQRKLASGKRTRGDWGFGRGYKLTCCCSIAFFQMKPVRPPLAAKCPCLPIAPTELESAGSGACSQAAAPQQVEAAVPPRDVLNSNDARQGRPVSVLASVRVEIELTTIDCLRSQDEDTLLPHSRAASIRERLYVRISRLGAGT